MKKLTLIIAIVFSGMLMQAQVNHDNAQSTNNNTAKTLFVNGKDINKLQFEYIEIVAYTTSLYGKKWAITFDIGDEYVSWKGHTYKDENGEVVDFKSPMDALNFLVECGWEFVSNNGGFQGNATSLFYLMHRKKNKDSLLQ